LTDEPTFFESDLQLGTDRRQAVPDKGGCSDRKN